MQAMAANLTDEDMTNLAVYYASQPAVSGKADADLVKSGQVKAAMCQGCHGSAGQGNGQFPRLAGQRPDYLVKQLNSFKEGKRSNGQMKAVAGSLSEEDMKALAAYFSAL
jgi:cytochrome c553